MNIPAAREAIAKIKEAAIETGIEEHMFLSFGTALGKLRENGFIPHDDDIDVGFHAEKFGKEEEDQLLANLKKKGLFKARYMEQRRGDTGRALHISIKEHEQGTKSCVWFMFPWNSYYWHSKGKDWVLGHKFYKHDYKKTDDGIMLGAPERYLGETVEADFEGGKYRFPSRIGSCCDYWYDNWYSPKLGGTSARKVVCVVGQWSNPNTWKIL